MDLDHRRVRQGRKRQRQREMHISNGEEMETLKDNLMDRPCLKNHIAICQEENVSFDVPAELRLNGNWQSNLNMPGGEEEKEKELEPKAQRNLGACHCRQQGLRAKSDLKRQSGLLLSNCGTQADAQPRLSGGQGAAESWPLADVSQGNVGVTSTPASCSLSGRQIVGKADSWPHQRLPVDSSFHAVSKSDFSLNTLLAERDEVSFRQRRPSRDSDQDKTARRKMRVYSMESPSEESISSGSLDCESMFTGTLFDDEMKDNDFLNQSFSLDDEVESLDLSSSEIPLDSMPGLESESETKSELVAQGQSLPVAACIEQEKRRFSASELINRLHLSPKRVAQALKLSKSLSGRSSPREKLTSINSLEGRQNVKQKSKSLISINSNASPKPQRDGLIFDSPPPHTWRTSVLQRRVESEEEISVKHLRERRHSKFLMSSILYQEYSNVASDREIQRQKRADTVIEDYDVILPRKCNSLPPNAYWSQRSARGNAFALWQDIPDVRRSGLLDRIGNEQRKLQEAKFELVTSEGSYLHSLTIMVEHFQNSKELQECLNAQEKQWLFSKLPEVKEVSEKFLQQLEERLEKDTLNFDVCDIVLGHCSDFRRVYLPYVTNQAYQEQTYQRLLQENPRFPGILARLQEDPICQRLPLTSFLILPFQRIMRLKMLVENILKRTKQGSQDEETATKALDKLKKLTQECNSSVQSMKRTEELIHLNNKFHFESKHREVCSVCPCEDRGAEAEGPEHEGARDPRACLPPSAPRQAARQTADPATRTH
ncbi:rho guanine nucleotide exchange factor 19 isoform X2 [Narcine bancroftii]|uniref:rho guanine nucleotide exchange factor 19 isoform X2 n=1 Tax=Narcine bancroftii TaxID=1343680 RepID=UPI00383177F7